MINDDRLHILLIEDNPGDVRLVQDALGEPSQHKIALFVADTLKKAKKFIAAERIHVILLDLNLPDSEGFSTFTQVHKFAFNVPIIILSILSDKQLIFQAMKEGAQDYLIKGSIENESLDRAIRYASWSRHETKV